VQTSIVCIPHICLSVTNLPAQQISEGKHIQTERGVELGPGKQRGKKDGLITVGGRKLMHIVRICMLQTLPKN